MKSAPIAASSSGVNAIVAAVTGKKICVVSFTLVSRGTVNAKWQSGSTDLTGAMAMVVNQEISVPGAPVDPGAGQQFWLETAVNTALNLNLSGAVEVDGWVNYELK